MPGGDELAVHARERAVVDGELHLNRGRINGHERERGAVLRVRDGFADEDLL